MPVITVGKESNLWQEICSEFAIKRAQAEAGAISSSFLNYEKKYPDNNEIKQPLADKQIYDPSKHSPVFCNSSYIYAPIDDITQIQIDTRISHPACINYALTPIENFQRELTKTITPRIQRPITPMKKSPKELSTIEYLEKYVYPILLKGIEQLLVEAEKRKCLERKRSAFNALDYLTRYLYYKNPNRINLSDEQNQQLSDINQLLEDIPFVRIHFEKYPRAPLPKSLLWSEEEAALIIQSYYRGYRVRKQPEVQELRQWQREWREANRNIHDVVEDFWRQHASPSPV
ncbi:unnamed protein product [Rotaria sp. Silwood2]|nr:unnamed protein product [Rotaria sp. Silwood2]CAF2628796.1 unnamed protein product [Rotaria sp. Silwood2]CAF2878890.1 unnamed protein product [Rotaria sp. Silwood2]CAF3926238.1 unnamed protein product [Rotaria sp. Silwood2]CAF3984885.1 unnamed protein product [Rotaria sp. Silwood2]